MIQWSRFGNIDCDGLGFERCLAEPIDERHPSVQKKLRRLVDGPPVIASFSMAVPLLDRCSVGESLIERSQNLLA